VALAAINPTTDRSVNSLDLSARRVAVTVGYDFPSAAGFRHSEVRVDDLVGGSHIAQILTTGLAGQTFVGAAFAGETCTGPRAASASRAPAQRETPAPAAGTRPPTAMAMPTSPAAWRVRHPWEVAHDRAPSPRSRERGVSADRPHHGDQRRWLPDSRHPPVELRCHQRAPATSGIGQSQFRYCGESSLGGRRFAVNVAGSD
jgi:hypothetical protein